MASSKTTPDTPEVPDVASPVPKRMPSSQGEAWNRICMAIEAMVENQKAMLEAVKSIVGNTSDMADELSEIKAHITSAGGD